MHELSLAGGIVRLVEDAAERERFCRVSLLRLEAGALSGVEVRALRFALEASVSGTCLEGAEILIDEPPGPAWCLGCGRSVEIGSPMYVSKQIVQLFKLINSRAHCALAFEFV